MARVIAEVTKVEMAKAGGDVVLEFKLDDGTKEEFKIESDKVRDIMLRISTFNMGAAPPLKGALKTNVSYEAGLGRVALTIHEDIVNPHLLTLAMGHEAGVGSSV